MTAEFRLLTYCHNTHRPCAGVLIGDRVLPAGALLEGTDGIDASSVLTLLKTWDEVHPRLHAIAQRTPPLEGFALDEVRLMAPILYPGTLFCAGANYWDHFEEMAEITRRTTGKAPSMTKPQEPWFFLKTTAGSVIGTKAPIHLPAFSRQVDWEAELGVVIGRVARDLPESRAFEAVAGYVIVNDLSARDLMKREGTPFVYDWVGQKCFHDAAPMGPWLTPAAYAPDPRQMGIKLWVNDQLKQDSDTSRMVHGIAEQIAYLSRHVALQPGDVIATGTPAGVGMPRGEFLKPGDEVRIEITGCGVLTNPVVAT